MTAPVAVEIRYAADVPADEDVALALARRLFAVLDERIDSLLLVPAAEDLSVWLNGRPVYTRREAGREPRVADVTGALAATRSDDPAEGGSP